MGEAGLSAVTGHSTTWFVGPRCRKKKPTVGEPVINNYERERPDIATGEKARKVEMRQS
jgi:hypothetical protein